MKTAITITLLANLITLTSALAAVDCKSFDDKADQFEDAYRKQHASQVEKCDASRDGACKALWDNLAKGLDKIYDEGCAQGCQDLCE